MTKYEQFLMLSGIFFAPNLSQGWRAAFGLLYLALAFVAELIG